MTAFAFNDEQHRRASDILSRYPAAQKASATLPLLDLTQRANGGWLSRDAIQYVADFLSLPLMRVYEVASFYTMFNLKPVGKHLVQVCRTTPCWLRGADALTDTCKKHLNVGIGGTTADNQFTLVEVECLGACVNAPVVQVNDDYYEDITPAQLITLLDDLKAGKKPSAGSQAGRQFSKPQDSKATAC